MSRLTPHEIVVMFLSLGLVLALARAMGEVMRRFSQPSILGEILAGIVLGPTILGALAPKAQAFLFPPTGGCALALNALTTLAVVLFLLVAGMEVDLSTVRRQGRTALAVSLAGMLIPFIIGFGAATAAPAQFGRHAGADPLIFALFFATALAISALPVIAKTLMDLNLYRSDVGMTIIAAAMFDDLCGWIIFAVILGLLGASDHSLAVNYTIAFTLVYVVFMLTAGRWLIHRALPWVQAHTAWPGGVVAFAVTLALLGASFTEWIGVHAIFGSFIVGVAIGDSPRLREETRTTIASFVSFVFAPLFFGTIGLKMNFAAYFDPVLCLLVLTIACAGKLIGCGIGARIGGMAPREAWAVGFGMNARGAMEIILGKLALEHGVIAERMFVALVFMAIATSMMAGPAVRAILRLKHRRGLADCIPPTAFAGWLDAVDRQAAIGALSTLAAEAAAIPPERVFQAVWTREMMMPTGVGSGIAVPHARLDGLSKPIISVGLSGNGIDFDAPDGEPAHLIFLILTPQSDDGAQVEILASIARAFATADSRRAAMQIKSYPEFVAMLKRQEVQPSAS